MPSVSCPGINTNAFLDCTKPMLPGVGDMLYLFNWADIAAITENVSYPNLIEGLTLTGSAKIYRFEGKKSSNEPKSTLVEGRYQPSFTHEVVFKMFNIDSPTKQQLEYMCNTKVVAIVENNFKGADGEVPFEIYGLRSGLQMRALERVLNDQDTLGAYNCTLGTSDIDKEPYLPATLFDTDYATTKAIITALFTA